MPHWPRDDAEPNPKSIKRALLSASRSTGTQATLSIQSMNEAETGTEVVSLGICIGHLESILIVNPGEEVLWFILGCSCYSLVLFYGEPFLVIFFGS